ncbi:hypothetical protein EVAR_79005_1 [Eumeta japonica]|uniref:Uncharacterized protein n=1 Tax=Eumeta variegata TaxID=151549 RepID=A0A4C1US79_EUMVA|nr:hypothetical protein EVAR_79005_1 [Eumeta japonica]
MEAATSVLKKLTREKELMTLSAIPWRIADIGFAEQRSQPSIATLKGYPTDDALVGCYVLGKTLGRSADLKVKNETLFYTSAADLAYME